MKSRKFDYVIVGAGPAGLFAANEILTNEPKAKVCLIEKGKRIDKRTAKDIMSGVGGTGSYSDGKLHFTPILSHEKMFHLYTASQIEQFLKEVDERFVTFGVTAPFSPADDTQAHALVHECKQKDVQLYYRKLKHVGSDALPKIIKNIQEDLLKKKITLMTETEALDIVNTKGVCTGIVTKDKKTILAEKTLIAPGRAGTRWLQQLCVNHDISHAFEKIEIGVRVEFPSILMKRFSDVMYECIFTVYTPTFDDIVRTFCPCPNGYVATEKYEGFVSANGHSYAEKKSPNSNFAFVTEIQLTEPVENTTQYALSIAKLATTIGGGKLILQRLEDFRKGRRSTWDRINRSYVNPTHTDVTPGDISMALPHRIVMNLKEGIEKLDRVMSGLNSGATLLYAPEIKLRSSKIKTDAHLQTQIKNLFVAGDAAGLSGSITGAAVNGLLAGRGMMGK